MPEELADHLAALDAEAADLEPDDIMRADGSDILTGDGMAGDADDTEDDDPAGGNIEDNGEEWFQPVYMPGSGSGPSNAPAYAKGEAVR